MKEKLVLVGAGSAMFTRGLIADLLNRKWEAELALVDTAPEALDDLGSVGSVQQFNAATTMLDALQLKVGQQFEYLFDFGDRWRHQIKVQEVRPPTPGTHPWTIVDLRGDSPPQYPDDE